MMVPLQTPATLATPAALTEIGATTMMAPWVMVQVGTTLENQSDPAALCRSHYRRHFACQIAISTLCLDSSF